VTRPAETRGAAIGGVPTRPVEAPRRVAPGLRAALVAAAGLALAACGSRGESVALAGPTGPPAIRVLLGGPRESAALASPDEWRATALQGSSWSEAGSNLSAGLLPSARGIVFRGTATGATSIRVAMRGAFTVEDEAGQRVAYRGDLLVRQDAGRLLLVDEVDLETYVAGVIVNEIGVQAVPASFRAQAVAARSYAYVQWKEGPDAGASKSCLLLIIDLVARRECVVASVDGAKSNIAPEGFIGESLMYTVTYEGQFGTTKNFESKFQYLDGWLTLK